jgi:hypothetical protein
MVSAVTLIDKGHPKCEIVLPEKTDETLNYAANELASHLKLMSGCEIAITSERNTPNQSHIYIGLSHASKTALGAEGVKLVSNMAEDELLVRTCGNDIVLAGGSSRGVLYAVYALLEDVLGCRWYASDATYVPKHSTVRVGKLDIHQKPGFEYRLAGTQVYYRDPTLAVRNRVNAQEDFSGYWPGGRYEFAVRYVHTFAWLVPASEMAAHPDWFSAGTKPEDFQSTGQLCLTAPGLEDYIVNKVQQWLADYPNARAVSISQNDNVNFCKCERCAALAEKIDQSGIMLDFVNRINARLHPEYPKVRFHTLAYQYTETPPKTIRPDDNLLVQLCTTGAVMSKPLGAQPYAQNVKDWAKVSNSLSVWYYASNFSQLLAPMPIYYNLGPSFRFMAQNHVKAVLVQDGFPSSLLHGCDFPELRAWMVAQLLWNPYKNDRKLLREFCYAYYGPAAKPILAYIDLLQKSTAKEDWGWFTSGAPNMPSMNWKFLKRAEELFEKAESAVASDQTLLTRVQRARLAVDYIVILRGPSLAEDATKAKSTWPERFSRSTRSRAFFNLGEKTGLVKEWSAGNGTSNPFGSDIWSEFVRKYDRRSTPEISKSEVDKSINETRSSLNSSGLDNVAKYRVGVLLNAAEYAAKNDTATAQMHVKLAKKGIDEGGLSTRQITDSTQAHRWKSDHKLGSWTDWDSLPVSGGIAPDRAWYGKAKDIADCSAQFKMAWDKENLYYLITITDDVYVPEPRPDDYWKGDGIELYINVLDDYGLPGMDGKPTTAFGPDDFQVIVNADGKVWEYKPSTGGQGNTLAIGDIPGMKTATHKTANGYELEVAIPFKSIFLTDPFSGYTLGIDIAINESDKPGALKAQLKWKSDKQFYDTTGWGRVTLSE